MQCGSVFEKRFLIFRGVLLHRNSGLRGVADDLVVHVGDVHYVADFVSALAKIAAQKIHGDEGAEVADVAVVVDRGPAGVHADLARHERPEFFNFAGKCIEQAQGHKRARNTQF